MSGVRSQLTALHGDGSGNVLITLTERDRPNLYSELEFNVHGMPPNSTFDIQRRFDTAPDGKCSSATWLELGTIKTSRAGTGTAHFTTARGAPFVTGFEFDIQYRVIGSDTELRSKCLTLVI